MPESVLEFRSVCYNSTSDRMRSVSEISLAVSAGDVLILQADRDSEHAPITDLGLGLLAPDSGEVLFMGNSWSNMNAFEEAANRGRTGCIFEDSGWISSLSVIANIMLRERHHTQRTEESIVAEVKELIGMAGISDFDDLYARPDVVRHRMLRIYEWVRACMGNPAIIMMSFPERGAASYSLNILLKLVEHVVAKDSAVVWATDNADVISHGKNNNWLQSDCLLQLASCET